MKERSLKRPRGLGVGSEETSAVTQPAVRLDAACVARENKFLKQVYLLVEEG